MNQNTVQIPYSSNHISLEFPENCKVDIIQPNKLNEGKTFDLKSTCSRFLSDKRWEILKNKSVLIVVNDATRATPTELLLDELVPFFNDMNIKFDFIIATGSHRKPTSDELKSVFGKFYLMVNDRIFSHDAKDDLNLVEIGISSFNSVIKVNKILFDDKYSGILTINSIEPHYFAGWTGGRKSVVPGLAGYETITKTHIHALSSESKNCRLEGNPVHDDLQEGFNLFLEKINKQFFTFQFVIDSKGTIHELFAGDYSVFQKGVQFASKIFQVSITREYDLVIAVAYPPLDQDLYQSHKALENCKPAIKKINLKNKSNFILISPCKNGIGPDQFLIPFKNNQNVPFQEAMKDIANNYKLGFHKAGKILEAEEYTNLFIYSELESQKTASAHFKLIEEDLNKFIFNIIKNNNINNVLIVMDACVTVPVLNPLLE